MDNLRLKTYRDDDIWFDIDKDGDLSIESEYDDRTVRLYVRKSCLLDLREWLNEKLGHSATPNPNPQADRL